MQTTGSSAKATVDWYPPSDTGGGAVTYTVTASPGGATGTVTGTHAVINGLNAGTAYTVTIRATNGGGLYSEVTTSNTTPTAASAPTNVVAAAGTGKITVTWDTPSSLGSISPLTYYYVTPIVGGVEQTALKKTVDYGTNTVDFTALTTGTTYTYVVRAYAGDCYTWNSSYSAPSTASNAISWS